MDDLRKYIKEVLNIKEKETVTKCNNSTRKESVRHVKQLLLSSKNLTLRQKTFVWLSGIWFVCQLGLKLNLDLLQSVDCVHTIRNELRKLWFANYTALL